MKKSYRIFLNAGENDIPLTVSMYEKNNVYMAYSLFYYMGLRQSVVAHGDDLHLLDEDRLIIRDNTGKEIEALADAEWYGTERDEMDVRKQILDGLEQEAKKEGCPFDRKTVAADLRSFFVVSWHHGEPIYITPPTWEYAKANDVVNILKHALCKDIEFYSGNGLPIDRTDLDICIGMSADTVETRDEPGWAKQGIKE